MGHENGSVYLLLDGKSVKKLKPGEFPVDLGELAQSIAPLLKVIEQNGGINVTLDLTQRNEVLVLSNARQRPIQPRELSRIQARKKPYNRKNNGDNPVVITDFQIRNRLPTV